MIAPLPTKLCYVRVAMTLPFLPSRSPMSEMANPPGHTCPTPLSIWTVQTRWPHSAALYDTSSEQSNLCSLFNLDAPSIRTSKIANESFNRRGGHVPPVHNKFTVAVHPECIFSSKTFHPEFQTPASTPSEKVLVTRLPRVLRARRERVCV